MGSTLRCCEVRKGLIEMLMLVAIDPLSGRRLWDRRLCDLLPEWWARRIGSRRDPQLDTNIVVSNYFYGGDCQIAVEGGTLFIATAGSVICCDPEGRLRWVRRLPWLGPAGDNWWWYQCPQPPLVHGDSVIVAPPGVQAVVAIDVASGRLRWQTPLPLARRFVGLAGVGDAARLVVETGAGIVACDPRDGTLRTILPAQAAPGPGPLGLAPTRLLGAAVATADGMAIVAVQRPRPDTPQTNARDVEILWIDVASGEVRHRAPVPALTGSPPWLGPMAVAGERLWLLAAPDLQKPQPADLRRALWELAPQPAP
ncbi:MAG: PQQ-binding-like beta-propeller repeat protein [Planctomycetia bacterium]